MSASNRIPHGLSASEQAGSVPIPLAIKPVESVYGQVCPTARCVHCGQFLVHSFGDPGRVVFPISADDFFGDPPEQLGRVLCPECGRASWDGQTFAVRTMGYLGTLLGEGRTVFPVLVRVSGSPHRYTSTDSLAAACQLALEDSSSAIVWITMGG